MDEILKFIFEQIELDSNKKEFSKKAGIGMNTLNHLKNKQNINLTNLIKIVDTLGYKIKFEKKEV